MYSEVGCVIRLVLHVQEIYAKITGNGTKNLRGTCKKRPCNMYVYFLVFTAFTTTTITIMMVLQLEAEVFNPLTFSH